MNLRRKPTHLQLNLLPVEGAPAELPGEKNDELVHALVELLVNAAKDSAPASGMGGGQDESEADQ